jgi:hypothetical protein
MPTVFLLAALSLLAAAQVWGDTMRCGKMLIRVGDSMAAVRAYCGRPAASERGLQVNTTTKRVGGRAVSQSHTVGAAVPVETWTYNRGPRKLLMTVRFVDGSVVSVKTLSQYGYPR